MEILKVIFGAGFAERGKKIAVRSYNVLLLITLSTLASFVFSVINRDPALSGWLFALSLVGGMISFLFYYVIAKMYDKDLGYVLCACFVLWIPTEILSVASMIVNLGKMGGAAGSKTPYDLLVKGVVLIAGLLIVASPALVLPAVRKEWALSRKAKMMIAYDCSVCYLVVGQEEIRVEMSPRFFWTKNVAYASMGTKFRDEDESKEDGSLRIERKKDQMTVFRNGELLYEFEVPSYVDLVLLYFPPKDK